MNKRMSKYTSIVLLLVGFYFAWLDKLFDPLLEWLRSYESFFLLVGMYLLIAALIILLILFCYYEVKSEDEFKAQSARAIFWTGYLILIISQSVGEKVGLLRILQIGLAFIVTSDEGRSWLMLLVERSKRQDKKGHIRA